MNECKMICEKQSIKKHIIIKLSCRIIQSHASLGISPFEMLIREMERRQQEMDERESELKRREQEMDGRETELKRREQEMDGRESELKRREQEMDGRETELKRREQEMDGREK